MFEKDTTVAVLGYNEQYYPSHQISISKFRFIAFNKCILKVTEQQKMKKFNFCSIS